MKKNVTTIVHLSTGALMLTLLMGNLITATGQTSHPVDVTNYSFSPDELTIQVGDTVVWTNSMGSHNVNGTQADYPDNPESFGNDVGSGWEFSHVFTLPGTYDYHCNPHLGLGMTGAVIVQESVPDTLTINFSGMAPHVGQTLWLAVTDVMDDRVVARISDTIEESFAIVVPGIESGHSYEIDFFADFNSNGYYDAPSTDHAWRLELTDAAGNEVLDFVHNTNFTDIEWEHLAIVNLSGMTPHVGQEIYFALIDSETGEIVDRESRTVEESFTVELSEIEPGKAYYVDFFADFNSNGYYDAPSTDHAWRLEIASAAGDEVFDFVHNTNFTDIDWRHRLRVRFAGMTPHVGQMLTLYVRDAATGDYLDTVVVSEIMEEEFDVASYMIEPGGSYLVDFYADLNGNGTYDAPPTDHAWRLETGEAMGDVDLDFTHNTEFTDIFNATTVGSDPASDVSLYPNPATDRVFVSSGEELVSVTIFNVTGAPVLILNNIRSSAHVISLEGIPAGLYFMDITTADRHRKLERLIIGR